MRELDQRWLVSAVIGPCSKEEAVYYMRGFEGRVEGPRLAQWASWSVAPYTEPAEDVNDSLKSLSVKVEQIKQ
jgi:hypothetical protein